MEDQNSACVPHSIVQDGPATLVLVPFCTSALL